jgi:hypothetical protein
MTLLAIVCVMANSQQLGDEVLDCTIRPRPSIISGCSGDSANRAAVHSRLLSLVFGEPFKDGTK